eukprot:1195958-Prorocentrum_minimum.AAC.8
MGQPSFQPDHLKSQLQQVPHLPDASESTSGFKPIHNNSPCLAERMTRRRPAEANTTYQGFTKRKKVERMGAFPHIAPVLKQACNFSDYTYIAPMRSIPVTYGVPSGSRPAITGSQ